ncbi:MAG: DUF4350 domain-containing protein [Marmoricola sp.]
MTTAAPAPTRAGWLRRYRAGLLVGAALVAAIAFAAVGSGGQRYTADLDPANARPGGARAVAEVLGHEGVDVQVVRSADAFDRARVDAGTTVVVTSMDDLGPSTLRRLTEHAGDAQVVLVDPGFGIPDALNLPEGVGLRATVKARGACADPRFDDLRIESRVGTAFPAGPGVGCFAVGDRYLLTTPTEHVTFLGAADLLANEQISSADNAAVALRLLGQHDRLVWYVPDAADLAADDGVSLSSLLPRWLGPSLVLASVALLALIGWRGRRLGRLVTEPLPVVVTAIETTRSRGRLYRKVNDRAHAADMLRRAARFRLAADLGLPRGTHPDALVRDVAAHSTRPLAQLHELLVSGAAPRNDNDLIRLANDLAELRKEVRSS